MQFVDLFAGLGGFGLALSELGHECVFVSELDDELRSLYVRNHRVSPKIVYGDIHQSIEKVPEHDILCAGFPCQPFSKSGFQRGLRDGISGTAFDAIQRVLELRHPRYLLLENVGNFERHDGGRTWRIIRCALVELGYNLFATEHKGVGGSGLLSPHQIGVPQLRDRFFILGDSEERVPPPGFVRVTRDTTRELRGMLIRDRDLSSIERRESKLSEIQLTCIDLWQEFLDALPSDLPLPSCPLWSDEFGASYPYADCTPYWSGYYRAELQRLPSYARSAVKRFPYWKLRFIEQNRRWYRLHKQWVPTGWLRRLRQLPSSYRKLEWNAGLAARRDLREQVLQFRPSGLRVRRANAIPALVAMTPTQLPILGARGRYLVRREALALQSFPSDFRLPEDRNRAFKALGNAVNVRLAAILAQHLVGHRDRQEPLPLSRGSHGPGRDPLALPLAL